MNLTKLIAIAVLCSAAATAPAQQATTAKPNLLTNPSFEDGQNGWEFKSHHSRGTVAVDATEKRDGRVPAQTLLDYLDDHFSLDEFLDRFPSVKREDAVEFLRLARGTAHGDPPRRESAQAA